MEVLLAKLVTSKEGQGRGQASSREVNAVRAELAASIAAAWTEPLRRTSQVSREYRQLAKLLPAGDDSRLRALQRRLGSLVATPVMRSKERAWLAKA